MLSLLRRSHDTNSVEHVVFVISLVLYFSAFCYKWFLLFSYIVARVVPVWSRGRTSDVSVTVAVRSGLVFCYEGLFCLFISYAISQGNYRCCRVWSWSLNFFVSLLLVVWYYVAYMIWYIYSFKIIDTRQEARGRYRRNFKTVFCGPPPLF